MIKNPRYSEPSVVVDMHLHGLTTASRDTIALIKAGEINMVSVEHSGDEVYNEADRRLEAASLVFYGIVPVAQGACKVCTIRNNSAADADSINDSLPEGKGMEIKELSEKVAALEATVKELGAVKAALDEAEKKIKELSTAPKIVDNTATVQALENTVKELSAKVAKLEAAPAGTKTTVVAEPEHKLVILG
jgi:seryl-tRNA synthetase